MNKTIKRGLLETHAFHKNEVPIIMYSNVRKYKNVPFLINKHNDLELLFVEDGRIEMHLDDAVFYAEKGDIIVANNNVLHNIVPMTESVFYECIIFDRDFCERYGFSIEKNHIQEIIKDSELFDLMYRIKSRMGKRRQGFYVAEVTIEVLRMLLILFQKYATVKSTLEMTGSRLMVEKGLEYIHEHFCEQIDVDAVAHYSGYSKYYFCRRFKEITGCTVNTYINMQRATYAKELLSELNMNISEVASECGFNNIPYFAQIFRRYVGVSPSEFKKRMKKPLR